MKKARQNSGGKDLVPIRQISFWGRRGIKSAICSPLLPKSESWVKIGYIYYKLFIWPKDEPEWGNQ